MNESYVIYFCIILFSIGILLLGIFDSLTLLYGGRRKLNIREKKAIIKNKINNTAVLSNYRKRKINKEIYEGLSILRNIASTEKDKRASCEYIVQCLANRKSVLQKTYYRMLSLMRVGKVKEAENLLCNTCSTTIGEGYASILVKWEYTEQNDLQEIICSFQRSVAEVNITEEHKKEELISDLIYIPAMLNVLVVFINFIYTGFYAHQRELLKLLF